MEPERVAKTEEEVVRERRTVRILVVPRRVIAHTWLADPSVGRIARDAGRGAGTLVGSAPSTAAGRLGSR